MQSITATRAYAHSKMNRVPLRNSRRCACFYCLRVYAPQAIMAWTDRDRYGGWTALCPFCAVDAVIGDASGFELTPEFLRMMRTAWFEGEAGPAPLEPPSASLPLAA